MRKYNFNEHYFDVIDCQEKAYWLGFFAADGYNHASKGCIEFRLHKQDKEILEKFKSCIEANNPIGLYKQTYCNLSLYSNSNKPFSSYSFDSIIFIVLSLFSL